MVMADALVALCLPPAASRCNPNPTMSTCFLSSSSSSSSYVEMTRTGTVPLPPLVFCSSFCKNFKPRTSFKIRAWEKEDDIHEVDGEEEVEEEEEEDLEEEVYKFMMSSKNPSAFPTRDELIAAGRVNLASAIARRGGWLALGWDLEEREGDDRMFSSSNASSSGRLVEVDWEEDSKQDQQGGRDSGVQGILCRLEKERSLSYNLGIKTPLALGGDNLHSRSSDMEIVPGDHRKSKKKVLASDMHLDSKLENPVLGAFSYGKINGSSISSISVKKSQNQIHSRLQELESRLSSTLTLLKSKGAVVEAKSYENTGSEFHDHSDAWEFKQTEIIKARDKLRSIKAKVTVLEGKMSLQKVEAEKILEQKQKRVDTIQNALHLLKTACIVWPNSAAEVLLSGSFDGWASQRRMERSSSGIFFLYVKLYPGQYKMKFIVDGVWRIDPLRPIVNDDGYENNLLMVT